MTILEEQRFLNEDIERLEQAITDRLMDEPKNIRERLSRDHEIAGFQDRIASQSKRLLEIYEDKSGSRAKELQEIDTAEGFDFFYKKLDEIRDFHRRYPNQPVENLERAYKKRVPEGGQLPVDGMFTGEEFYGRFFDLTILHEEYLNLPGLKNARRINYLQYLDTFDIFTPPQCPIKRPDKMSDAYFQYLRSLAEYPEGFMRRTKPLEPIDKVLANFDKEFTEAWEAGNIPGWEKEAPKAQAGPATEGTGEGVWCADCEKEFGNANVYKHHVSSKKHIKNTQARAARGEVSEQSKSNGTGSHVQDLKDRAIAEREFRIKKLASAMQTERSDTRVNVERKQGMTDRERQQELAALFDDAEGPGGKVEVDDEDDGDDKIYNPLKLPLGWDGKPIPFWLYKLHGLGVEFPCEICGNFVYMGRRAYDKHFGEARHIYGLKCLGITHNTALFREIANIDEALKLWDKLERDKKKYKQNTENVVQMEDAEGNVMPEKVYYDLQKQGLL